MPEASSPTLGIKCNYSPEWSGSGIKKANAAAAVLTARLVAMQLITTMYEDISPGGLTYDSMLTGREHQAASFQVFFWGGEWGENQAVLLG